MIRYSFLKKTFLASFLAYTFNLIETFKSYYKDTRNVFNLLFSAKVLPSSRWNEVQVVFFAMCSLLDGEVFKYFTN